jgi:hypothetical protein
MVRGVRQAAADRPAGGRLRDCYSLGEDRDPTFGTHTRNDFIVNRTLMSRKIFQ